MSVTRYDCDMRQFVTREIVRARASSPPLEPPWRMIMPTPAPTNIPPKTAAANGYAERSGIIGGNCSHSLKNPARHMVENRDHFINDLPRHLYAIA